VTKLTSYLFGHLKNIWSMTKNYQKTLGQRFLVLYINYSDCSKLFQWSKLCCWNFSSDEI